MSARVTRKGRVTIPNRIRDILGIQPGSAVEFEVTADGRVVLRSTGRRKIGKRRFAAIRGSATVKMRTEEIMALTRGEDY